MKFNALIPEFDIEDLATSVAFYIDVLGFEIAYQRPEEGFAFLQKGEAQLMLDTGRLTRRFDDVPVGQRGRGVNLQIRVTDLDQILEKLMQKSWPLRLQLEVKSYRVNDVDLLQKQFVVADPDGYLLRFFQEDQNSKAEA